jgi:hypothetical protein
MNNAKLLKAPEPTFGMILLAPSDADAISEFARIATATGIPTTEADKHVYYDNLRRAQLRLGSLARRLGYEIVPAREVANV